MARRHETPLKRVNPSGATRWVARYTGRDGNRHSAGTFALKREAQDAIDAAYDAEERAPSDPTTLGAYYENEWLQRHPRTVRTEASYNGRIRAVLDVRIDRRPLRDWPLMELRPRHADDLVNVLLRDQGRAAKGAQGILRVLSALFTDARRDGRADMNPFTGIQVRSSDRRIRKPARRIRTWSWGQMHAFCAAAGPYEPMLRVLSDCGLRIGELFPLERGDYHGDTLEVRRTAWRGSVTDGTKNDHGEAQAGRVVPVAPVLQGMLDAMPKRIDTRLLFPNPNGGVWGDRRWYDVVWYPTQKRAGIDPTPHEFRHSWVSRMRAARLDAADLASMSGHTVETATRHYTHALGLSMEQARKAVGE